MDADDVLPQDTIEVMLDTAYEYDADILQGSWYTFTNEKKKEHRVKESGKESGSQDTYQAIHGESFINIQC